MIKIGIDLSTTNIGVAVILGEELIFQKEHSLKKYNDDNLIDNVKQLKKIARELLAVCWKYQKNIMVGIELANFKNPQTTSRFAEYAGVLEAVFVEYAKVIKKFNSSQWQKMIGCKNNEERKIRKHKSQLWVINKFGTTFESDDINDAICIAYLLDKLQSTLEIKETTKATKNSIAKTKANQARIMKMIDIRQNKLLKLNPVSNAKQIATITEKIKELRSML